MPVHLLIGGRHTFKIHEHRRSHCDKKVQSRQPPNFHHNLCLFGLDLALTRGPAHKNTHHDRRPGHSKHNDAIQKSLYVPTLLEKYLLCRESRYTNVEFFERSECLSVVGSSINSVVARGQTRGILKSSRHSNV